MGKHRDKLRVNTIPALANRDPSKWKVVEVGYEDDPSVTFHAGDYVSSTGLRIPVTFKCHKSGIIYKAWLAEMNKRDLANKGPVAIDIEAEILEVNAIEGEKMLPRRLRDEKHTDSDTGDHSGYSVLSDKRHEEQDAGSGDKGKPVDGGIQDAAGD